MSPRTKQLKVAVLVEPDSVLLEIAVAQQIFGPPFRSIGEVTGVHDSPYRLKLCAREPETELPSGAAFDSLAPLPDLTRSDIVIVPGVEEPERQRHPEVLKALRVAAERGAKVASFCGGAFILAQAGLLDGRRATTHWLLANEFSARYPLVHLEPEHLYVADDPIFTSGGVLASVDLALHLVALDLGQAAANDVSRLMVSAPHRSGGQAQFSKLALRADHRAGDDLTSWLRDNLDRGLTAASVAKAHNLSERTLVRKFRQHAGMSLHEWLTRERVARAKHLLETTPFPVTEVAAMAGFGSAETMRRNFDKYAGVSAGQYRRLYRPLRDEIANLSGSEAVGG